MTMLLKQLVTLLSLHAAIIEAQIPSRAGRTSNIIGGTQISNKASHPWVCLMEGKIKTGLFSEKTTTCGATLIDRFWAVGAAHCFTGDSSLEDANKWTASVGTLHRYDWVHRYILHPIGWLVRKPEWQSWRLKVERIYRHPDFVNRPMFDHDIALIKLKDEAPVGRHPYVNTLQLPTANDLRVPEANSYCTVSGWGCTADGGSVVEQEMEVSMPILPRADCLVYWRNMTENQFCAGRRGENKGVCAGDSGGPMVCRNGTDGNFLAGIISFANSDDPEQYPAGFIYVAKYVEWIKGVIGLVRAG